MHPTFYEQRLHDQQRELERRLRHAHPDRSSPTAIEARATPRTPELLLAHQRRVPALWGAVRRWSRA